MSDLPPRGHYLAHEVGQLAGISGDKVGQWARRGYIRSSQSSSTPRVYSYQDVAETMIVHELVLRHVKLSTIKSTIARLRDELGTEWPLQRSQLYVPGQASEEHPARTVVRRTGAETLTDLASDHPVLEGVDLDVIAVDLSRGGWAVRQLPGLRHIEVNPSRLSGRPAIRGTRVAAEFVARTGTTQRGVELLKHDYGLNRAQIEDARRWWDVVSQYESQDLVEAS